MRAISVLSFETGTSTRWCLAAAALRRRVRKSAIGSVCMYLLSWHRSAGRHVDVAGFTLGHGRVINLWKRHLVLRPQRVIPAAGKGILRQSAEVAHAREHHVAQAVQKFVHVVATQRHRAPGRHALANLE